MIARNRPRDVGAVGLARCHSRASRRPSPRVVGEILRALLALACVLGWGVLAFLWFAFIAGEF